VAILLCRPATGRPSQVVRVLEIVAEPSRIAEVSRHLQRHSAPGTLALTRRSRNRLLAWTSETAPKTCRAVFRAGGMCLSCPLLPPPGAGHEVTWTLIVPRVSTPVRSLLRSFSLPSPEGERRLLRVRGLSMVEGLTSRQERAVNTAVEMGLFTHPRRTDLGQVARALGVSRPTALELVRRGLTHILAARNFATVRAGTAV